MTVMQCIDEFVRKAELRVPLYTNEIYEYVKTKLPDTDKATFNMTLQRYEKRNVIIFFQNVASNGTFLRYIVHYKLKCRFI